jgi:hypothetical protein
MSSKGNWKKKYEQQKKAKQRKRCKLKIQYDTQEKADEIAQMTGIDLVSYKCPFGEHYHVSHRMRFPHRPHR